MNSLRVVTLRRPRVGAEAQFSARLQAFVTRAAELPGSGPVLVVRPTGPGGSWAIVRDFADEAERRAFYEHPDFAAWESEIATYSDGPAERQPWAGLALWLGDQGTEGPPPRWKVAMATLIGVYPASLAVPMVLSPLIDGWPRWLSGLVIAAGIVVALTWLVMPAITRLLHGWLHPRAAPATASTP